MSLDLSGYDQPEHRGCMTARDISRHADLYILTYLCSNRRLVGHLLQTADDLMTSAQLMSRRFLHDGYDPSRATQDGLTEAQRLQVLTLAATCAYNATLYVQEAQRRRVVRVHSGWDPITTPLTV